MWNVPEIIPPHCEDQIVNFCGASGTIRDLSIFRSRVSGGICSMMLVAAINWSAGSDLTALSIRFTPHSSFPIPQSAFRTPQSIHSALQLLPPGSKLPPWNFELRYNAIWRKNYE